MCSCQKISGMKRKTRKTATRRRSRVGAFPSAKGLQNTLVNQALPLGAGFLLSEKIVGMLPDSVSKYSKYIKLVGGALIAGATKGMAQNFGLGMAGAGVSEIVGDAISINGVGAYLPGRPYTAIGSIQSGEGVPAETSEQPARRVRVI